MNYLYEITRAAEEKFKIRALKPYQILVMHRILEQEFGESGEIKNQLVILPTGTGKSLCFLIPALLCRGISIIVYPLLALMNDQISKLQKAGVDVICLRGGQTRQQRAQLFSRLEKGAKVVVTNPETLSTEAVKRELKKYRISLFVVDEAHTIIQWGESFRPAFSSLGRTAKELGAVQVLAFTATAGEKVTERIKESLSISDVISGDADRENIFYSAYAAYDREEAVMRLARDMDVHRRPTLVFCRKRLETEKLCALVRRNLRDIPVRYYHAGLGQREREELEKWFLESQDGMLFATCAYGMGVDKKNIRTVIHYSLPSTVQEYLQESGRAGRDGESACAVVLITEKEKTEKEKTELVGIFTAQGCRRKALLRSLGQNKEECSGCDWCASSVMEKPELYYTALKMISCRPLRFNAMGAAAVLCAEKTRMTEDAARMDRWWGKEKNMDQDLVEQSILQMPELGKVKQGDFIRLYVKEKKVQRFYAFIQNLVLWRAGHT